MVSGPTASGPVPLLQPGGIGGVAVLHTSLVRFQGQLERIGSAAGGEASRTGGVLIGELPGRTGCGRGGRGQRHRGEGGRSQHGCCTPESECHGVRSPSLVVNAHPTGRAQLCRSGSEEDAGRDGAAERLKMTGGPRLQDRLGRRLTARRTQGCPTPPPGPHKQHVPYSRKVRRSRRQFACQPPRRPVHP
jgi:hypothetical protein